MVRYIALWTLLLVAAALAGPELQGRTLTVDPGTPDTVRVDSTVAFVSGRGSVPVHFFNDELLFGLQLTLKESGSGIRIDSFSFAGGRLATFGTKGFQLNADSSIITLSVVPTGTENIPTGSGLLGTLYFSYPGTVTPQTAGIDTVTWLAPNNVTYYTSFILPKQDSLFEFLPQFRPGALIITNIPLGYDSLWVADANALGGHQVEVDVYLHNERNVKDISIALTWGTGRLTLRPPDSTGANYAGTRSIAARSRVFQTDQARHQVLFEAHYGDTTGFLPPGTGPMIRLFFDVSPTTPDTSILVDTVRFDGYQSSFLRLTTLDGYQQFAPLYHTGVVTVQYFADVNDGNDQQQLPKSYELAQNYPNPFNPTTEIEFTLPKASQVNIQVFNILGQAVRSLIDDRFGPGVHRVRFDGRNDQGQPLATGIYFYRMTAGDYRQSRKMMLLK